MSSLEGPMTGLDDGARIVCSIAVAGSGKTTRCSARCIEIMENGGAVTVGTQVNSVRSEFVDRFYSYDKSKGSDDDP